MTSQSASGMTMKVNGPGETPARGWKITNETFNAVSPLKHPNNPNDRYAVVSPDTSVESIDVCKETQVPQ